MVSASPGSQTGILTMGNAGPSGLCDTRAYTSDSYLLDCIETEDVNTMQGILNGVVSKEYLNRTVQMGLFGHPEDTWTPLMRAANKASGEMLSRLLVVHGIEVDRANLVGKTALMVAAHTANKHNCQALVGHGAVVTTKDSHGRDGLMYGAGGLRDAEACFP